MTIGLSSTILQTEALRAAVKEAHSGQDVQQYEVAIAALQDTVTKDADAVLNADWMEKVKKLNTVETGKLEAELKGYKNNLIKESIRVRMLYDLYCEVLLILRFQDGLR